MSSFIVSFFGLVLLLNLVCTGFLALAFRRRHRFLFNRTVAVQGAMASLSDTLRIEQRLSEIQHGRPSRDSSLPVRFTAQAGEDILIYDFFKNAPIGFFVEAGAYDGVTFSNTYLLESLGWKGLLVEPLPDYARLCEVNRPGSVIRQAALGPEGSNGDLEFTCAENQAGAFLSFLSVDDKHLDLCNKEQCVLRKVHVPYTSLNELLARCTDRVDFLSLDVEGMELEVLRGLDLMKYSPGMILIESDGRRPDGPIEAYLQERGYWGVGRKGCNRFFVPAEKRDQFLALSGHRAPLAYAD